MSGTVQKSFSVTGMTCSGCATRVENLLKQQAGVESAQVDLDQGAVRLTYDHKQVSPGVLRNVLSDTPYELATS